MEDLKGFYSVGRSIKAIRTFAIAALLVGFGTMGACFWMYQDMSNSIWVRDGADYYQVNRKSGISPQERSYDYKEHVTKAIYFGYQMDEGSYDQNMENLLILMGECGRDLYSKYQEQGTKNYLVQENAMSSVDSVAIDINMDTYPATGRAQFYQTFKRYNESKRRLVEAKFTIYDVSRWEKNKLGAKIEDWEFKFYDTP